MLDIDYRDSRPIYEQIADNFERMTRCGALAADEQLPSVRQLALELSINPNTIQKAYAEMEHRGVAYSVKGRGNFIAGNGASLREKRLQELERAMREHAREARELGAEEAQITSWIGLTRGDGKP